MADAAGAILLRAGVIGPQSLAAALAFKEREGGTLGEALIRLGLLDEDRLVATFQQSLLIPVVTAAELQRVPQEVLRLVSPQLAAEHRVVPAELDAEGNLTLAMADPTDNRALDEVAAHTGRFVMRAVAAPMTVRAVLLTQYGVSLTRTGPVTAEQQRPPEPRTPSGRHKAVQKTEPSRKNTLPPTAKVVPAAAVPAHPPSSLLSALARAVASSGPPPEGGGGSKPARKTRSSQQLPVTPPAEADGRKQRSTRAPGKAGRQPSGPILLERPARGSEPGTSTTLPGLGSPAEELLAPVARLRAADSRDEVITTLLDFAGLLAARVGLFVVQKGQLVCLDGRGPDHVVVAMKWFTIPVDTPSPFRDVLQSRAAYIGSLSDSPESRAFRNALGSTPGDLLLLPLVVGQRAVGVLYADEIRTDLGKLSVELQTLSREAGAAFARIILRAKSGSPS